MSKTLSYMDLFWWHYWNTATAGGGTPLISLVALVPL